VLVLTNLVYNFLQMSVKVMGIATTMELALISRRPASPGNNASVTRAGLERVVQDVSGHVHIVVSMQLQLNFMWLKPKLYTWEYQCIM